LWQMTLPSLRGYLIYEWKACRGVLMSSIEKKARRKVTSEFKAQAVKRVLAGLAGHASAVAREVGSGESYCITGRHGIA